MIMKTIVPVLGRAGVRSARIVGIGALVFAGVCIGAKVQPRADWPSIGHDFAGTRSSPLTMINSANVSQLGLAWTYDLESTRGVEATPIVVNGVMYVTAPWAVVHAINARTGRRIWTFDPKSPRESGWKACCDVVNRGVAVSKGRVYVGSLDGRLIVINASTGRKIWEQDTRLDVSGNITITAAPYVIRNTVIIGNGGGEYGIRGYVSAYNALTGALKWRWFVTPGDPSKPYEDESAAKAALTWDAGTKYWINGGGGAVWNTMAIDPELGLVYFGTGNGSPWSRAKRSPAGGDNLYTAAVVALNIETGKYVWHYQENPGDDADLDSCADPILADLNIGGSIRKVLLHAPKNGFFYVLDRKTGEFISANNFAPQNWAVGFNKQGRPIETPKQNVDNKTFEPIPGPNGAHNWQSMSFSPRTGLAYFPTQHLPQAMVDDDSWTGQDSYKSGGPTQLMGGAGWNVAVNLLAGTAKPFGRLVAWNPLKQHEAWSIDLGAPFNGGTLVTDGNLVFQGTSSAKFRAYDAANGRQLWESPVGSGVIAAPMTYAIDGRQYVSIAVGWGGVHGESQRHSEFKTGGTVYTFVLGGKTKMPAFTPYTLGPLLAGVKYDPKDIPAGTALYVSNCVVCHGVPAVDRGGNIPNLGYVNKEYIDKLDFVLFDGPFAQLGMPSFKGKFTPEQVEQLKAFIQGVADSTRPNPVK
jgi:quinohemoprotein ethanol dehydrogenase